MTVIKSIKIGDKVYPVMEEPGLDYKENVQAEIRYKEIKIRIEPNQEPQYEIDCLLHEAVHGMLEFMGEHDKNNEVTVSRLTNGLLMLVRDNPALFQQAIDTYLGLNMAPYEQWLRNQNR